MTLPPSAARAVRVRPLAKINLDLRVLQKRPDGFHELRTVFQTISLGDTLDIQFTPSRRAEIRLDSSPDIPNNLILQAAELLLSKLRISGRVAFRLNKRIPMGGGLGGGSSNAAAVLLALPVLAGRAPAFETLLDLAAQLGSDVPFFLYGGTALGMGRGAELYPLPEPPAKPLLLVTPGLHVSTAEAYAALNRSLTSQTPAGILESFQSFTWGLGERPAASLSNAGNDFEAAVFNRLPQLESIKGKLLKLGARPALMSGSGSTLFGVFDNRELRDRAAQRLGKEWGEDRVHAAALVGRRAYRALWKRWLRAHLSSGEWPPRSRYGT